MRLGCLLQSLAGIVVAATGVRGANARMHD
jgi:hypothetical protein